MHMYDDYNSSQSIYIYIWIDKPNVLNHSLEDYSTNKSKKKEVSDLTETQK